ncbi:Fic family protein [Collinsella sp. HCP3S3_B1]|uniref:Fido domain-containing protein n=1 Tax=Collinsella aerofaciens TaxID=74426 RepID=A0A6N9JLV9_9ACTN|nr:hypothetical protein [Collinsella aerofaciens]
MFSANRVLAYIAVKEHPFLDGNKRSAAAFFIHFLDKNGVLRDGETPCRSW